MTEHLFPDSTVLCNFAAVDRLDLLKSVLGGRGSWTEAAAYEASRASAVLPPLTKLAAEGWLDEPIEITDPAEVQIVAWIRRAVFGGRPNRPLERLGEAQTYYVIKKWDVFDGAWWISDDEEAVRYARHQRITTRETIDILRIAVADKMISAAEALGLMTRMADSDRPPRLPKSAEELRR